jgi:hypothetical protein
MDDSEIAHLLRLLETHKKVLNQLEEQAVGYAGAVPTHISLQIDSNKEAIEQVKAKLSLVLIPRRTADATGPDAASMVTRFRVEELHDMFSDALATLQRQIREQDEESQRQLRRVEGRTTQAITDLTRENARQTSRLDILRTNDEVREAWRGRIDQKLDELLYRQMQDDAKRQSGQRRNLILNGTVLTLLLLFVLLLSVFLRQSGMM